jgi:serine/threonine-protein kinase
VPNPTKREGAGARRAPAEARFEPRAGSIVDGKYVVDRVLGEGGMGVVVAATHLGLEQNVAIKFLAADAMRNREAVERFQREAKVAAKVKSEHVARVHDVGTVEGGVPYIVMEYLDGRDLRHAIDDEGTLAIDEACEIALQACEALAEVHAAGIVHRDLKPSNLFLTRRSDGSPCVKLLDFGISKFSASPDESMVDPALTTTATIMGSPSYMSPEQLKSTKEVDARTDVWSLGAVLYEALTGKPAFRAETVPQVCAMIASDDPPLPSGLRSDLPLGLEQAVLGCLEKKPEKRSSLVDLARVLAQHVPDRARASLERIEAVAAPGEPRSRAATLTPDGAPPPRRSRVSSLQEGRSPSRASVPGSETSQTNTASERPLADVERARTQASWSDAEGRRRARRTGRWPLLALVVVAGGVFALGVYTGGIRMSALRGRVASATSAVASAVESALPVATGTASQHHAPAAPAPPAPSAKPPSAPSASPAPSASGAPAASDEPDDEEEDPEEVASAIASAIAPYLAPYAGPAPGLSPPPAPPHPAAPPGGASASAKKHNPKHHKTWKKHH